MLLSSSQTANSRYGKVDPELRSKFNADFTPEKYAALVRCVNETEKWPADFRISETPIFLTREFTDEVTRAANEVIALTRTSEFAQHAASAVPKQLEVPNDSGHPHFHVVDFGIAPTGPDSVLRLIELQAFPSLFGFPCCSSIVPRYPVDPREIGTSLRWNQRQGVSRAVTTHHHRRSGFQKARSLEIGPEEQKTRVYFAAPETLLGVRPVCKKKIKKRDRQLFYDRDGREVRIERIYNRVIFDELVRRPDLNLAFRFQDDLDVKWADHPNWYFRISKHSLPFLKTEHTPPAFFADEFPAGEKIDNYVLKPLYSFAGHGVDMEPTHEKIGALQNPHEWILQKKIDYAAFVPTIDGQKSKAEIRMMFVWPEGDHNPTLVNNLVRMSQGRMMGVDFNVDKRGQALASRCMREGHRHDRAS
jgi:hypothetical protein